MLLDREDAGLVRYDRVWRARMVHHKDIEKVDVQALNAQRSLTEALWLPCKDRAQRRKPLEE
jgi:hypothetical protein